MPDRTSNAFLKMLTGCHSDFKFTGQPTDALLKLPEELLVFFVSILRDDRPVLPDAGIEEWNCLLQYLKAHMLWPLLYWKLSRLPEINRPPKEVMQKLGISYLQSMGRNVMAENQLQEILEAFQKEGIRSLLLKGLSLGFTVYPSPPARPFGDLDILISPSQFHHAKRVLCAVGYASELNLFELREDANCEEVFTSSEKRRPFKVELHWHIHQFFKGSFGEMIEDLFDRSRKVPTPSICIETLGDLDNLIYLSLHVLNHRKEIRLLWLHDIYLLLNQVKDEDDWKRLRMQSNLWDAALVFRKTIDLISFWFKPDLPAYYEQYFSAAGITELEQARFSDGILKDEPAVLLRLFLCETSTAFEKLLLILKLLFPQPQYIRALYPPAHAALLPLSYLRRWYSWLRRAVK